MKKLLSLTAAALVAMVGFVGCENPLEADNEDTLTLPALTAMSASNTQTVSVAFSASAIPTLTVTVTPASQGVTATIGTPAAKSGDVDLTITTSSAAVTGTYTISVELDNAGVTTTKTATFSVTGTVVDTLTINTANKIWNILGSGKGAYNLVADTAVGSASSATLKDLLDLTATAGPISGSLGTANGATFVALTSAAWNGATAASVVTATTGATATSLTVATGDYVGVKLGSSRGYAVLKITEVNTTDATQTGGNNKGYITFDYKFTVN